MRIRRAPAHRSRGVTAYFGFWKGHEKKAFNFVIVEALDRLSRDMEDLAGIHKRLSFLGIEIRAVHEGVVNTVLVGLRGLVGQLYREDNAHKIRRGQAGRVGQGLNAGGLTYGYAPIPVTRQACDRRGRSRNPCAGFSASTLLDAPREILRVT